MTNVMTKILPTMLCLLPLVAGAAETMSTKDHYEALMRDCPKERVLTTNPRVEIGRCVFFEGSINGARCRELRVSGRVAGWITDANTVGSKVIAHLCQMEPEIDGSYYADAWSQPGNITKDLYVISLSTDDPGRGLVRLVPLKLPGYSMYSNLSACRNKIAYWSSREKGESSQWEALVFDFSSRSVVSSKRMGFKYLETDYYGFLPPPTWNSSCDAVTFEYPENMHKPKETLRLSN